MSELKDWGAAGPAALKILLLCACGTEEDFDEY